MSSRSHQTYLRRWANQLKVPLFCIDYRLAPEHPYPAAIDDCWQAYNWIINYVHKFFNVNPLKIILVGDSAGGNLISGKMFFQYRNIYISIFFVIILHSYHS